MLDYNSYKLGKNYTVLNAVITRCKLYLKAGVNHNDGILFIYLDVKWLSHTSMLERLVTGSCDLCDYRFSVLFSEQRVVIEYFIGEITLAHLRVFSPIKYLIGKFI